MPPRSTRGTSPFQQVMRAFYLICFHRCCQAGDVVFSAVITEAVLQHAERTEQRGCSLPPLSAFGPHPLRSTLQETTAVAWTGIIHRRCLDVRHHMLRNKLPSGVSKFLFISFISLSLVRVCVQGVTSPWKAGACAHHSSVLTSPSFPPLPPSSRSSSHI